MNIGDIVESNLCNKCRIGDNSIYAECHTENCIKSSSTGLIIGKDPHNNRYLKLPINIVHDFKTENTSEILDEDLIIISSIK